VGTDRALRSHPSRKNKYAGPRGHPGGAPSGGTHLFLSYPIVRRGRVIFCKKDCWSSGVIHAEEMAARSGSLLNMERVCSQCRAVLDEETMADWCPACGGALIERARLPVLDQPGGPAAEVDHRGIVLPRRHAVGGIITPQ